mgnify:CR=1 FL=1
MEEETNKQFIYRIGFWVLLVSLIVTIVSAIPFQLFRPIPLFLLSNIATAMIVYYITRPTKINNYKDIIQAVKKEERRPLKDDGAEVQQLGQGSDFYLAYLPQEAMTWIWDNRYQTIIARRRRSLSYLLNNISELDVYMVKSRQERKKEEEEKDLVTEEK